jgi:hypothetical protein
MDPLIGLSLGRIAVGVTAIADPQRAATLFGLDPRKNAQLPLMTRLFGSREVALGVVTLATRGRARRRIALTGVAVDGADAYASITAMQEGAISTRTGIVLTAPAVLAALTGVRVLTQRTRKARAGTAEDAA